MKTQTSFVHRVNSSVGGWVTERSLNPAQGDPLVLLQSGCYWRVLWGALWLAVSRSHDCGAWYIFLRRLQHMRLEGWGKLLHYTKSSTPVKDFLGQFWNWIGCENKTEIVFCFLGIFFIKTSCFWKKKVHQEKFLFILYFWQETDFWLLTRDWLLTSFTIRLIFPKFSKIYYFWSPFSILKPLIRTTGGAHWFRFWICREFDGRRGWWGFIVAVDQFFNFFYCQLRCIYWLKKREFGVSGVLYFFFFGGGGVFYRKGRWRWWFIVTINQFFNFF